MTWSRPRPSVSRARCSRRSRSAAERGWVPLELVLILAIALIVIVGLAAIVDMPRQVMEREASHAPISSADRLLSRLDQDVRFARRVETPDRHTLRVTDRGGEQVTYRWNGVVGGSVIRTAKDRTSSLLRNVRALSFGLSQTAIRRHPSDPEKGSGDAIDRLPTSVLLRLQLAGSDEGRVLRTAFPVVNNITRANQ